MKIELLQGSFPVTENPGLDSTDPRFDEIVTLTQAGKHEEAASYCEAILVDGIYDIRLICYFLYGHWLEQGLASLVDVINCLNHIIIENWEAVGPISSRKIGLEKSLDWLFRQLLKKIKYEESKNSQLWQQWQASTSADDVINILESGETLRLCVSQQLDNQAGPVIDQWSKIEQWLQVYQQLEYREPEPAQIGPGDSGDDLESAEEVVPKPSDAAPMAPVRTGVLEIEVSYHLELLLKKLAAFEQLLEENKFPQAALLADDINQTLHTFDPKFYFPKIFETFVRLQAINFEELATYAGQEENPYWQAMQEWLKVDIDSFIDSPLPGFTQE